VSEERWFISFFITITAILLAFTIGYNTSKPTQIAQSPSPAAGFAEVESAKGGELITLTDWVDVKYLCSDVTPHQKETCTAAISRSENNRVYSQIITLWVCSDVRKTNCIAAKPGSELSDIYVLDSNGEKFDFIGLKLIQPSNAWMFDSKKVRITGRVTVVNGKGKLLEPIEKIDAP
jgi:hypothetical protein